MKCLYLNKILTKFMYFICFFVFMLILSACAGKKPLTTYATDVTPQIQKTFNTAEYYFRRNQNEKAIRNYQYLISKYEYNRLTDPSYIRLGEIKEREGSYEEAIENYNKAIKGLYSIRVTPNAKIKAARCSYKLGNYNNAIEYLMSINRKSLPIRAKLEADTIGFESSRALGGSPVVFSLLLLDDYNEGATNGRIGKSAAMGVVNSWMNDLSVTSESIKKMPLEDYKGNTSGGYVYYKLGYALHNEAKDEEAKEVLQGYLMTYGKHPYYLKANDLAWEVGSGINVRIGVILPLSGKFSRYGFAVLHGIQCATGIFEPCDGPKGVELLIRDADTTPEASANAVRELAAEGVVAIIGPLRSHNAPAAIEEAEKQMLPIVTLSQTTDTAEISNYAFRNSISPQDEIRALVDWLKKDLSIKQIFIMYPQNAKGEQYRDIFIDMAKRNGKRIVGDQSYATHQMEFAGRLKALASAKKTPDALFIPDSYRTAAYIAGAVAASSVKTPKLLGISRWNTKAFITKGGNFIEGATFPVTFDPKAPYALKFVEEFNEAYDQEPSLLEALGYDSFALIKNALQMGFVSREAIWQAMKSSNKIEGVMGELSIDSDGNVDHAYRVMKVNHGEIVPVE